MPRRTRNYWLNKGSVCQGSCSQTVIRRKQDHRTEVEHTVTSGWSCGREMCTVRVGTESKSNKDSLAVWTQMCRGLWWPVHGTRCSQTCRGPSCWSEEFECNLVRNLYSSSFELFLTFSSISVLVTSTSSAKPTSLSRLIPRPSLSKTFQVNRQPSSAAVSRYWSSKVSNIYRERHHGGEVFWCYRWLGLSQVPCKALAHKTPAQTHRLTDLVLGKDETGAPQGAFCECVKEARLFPYSWWGWNLQIKLSPRVYTELLKLSRKTWQSEVGTNMKRFHWNVYQMATMYIVGCSTFH